MTNPNPIAFTKQTIQEINQDQFVAAAKLEHSFWFVDFWAPWCGPCKQMHPVLDWIAEQPDSAKFKMFKINTDENQELSAQLNITGIPYFGLFKFSADGNVDLVKSWVGSRSDRAGFLADIVAAVDNYKPLK